MDAIFIHPLKVYGSGFRGLIKYRPNNLEKDG